jgi:hypothetical protein
MVGGWLWLGLLPGSAHAQVVSGGKDRPVVALEHSGHFGASTDDMTIDDMTIDGNDVYLAAATLDEITMEVVDISHGKDVGIFSLPMAAAAKTGSYVAIGFITLYLMFLMLRIMHRSFGVLLNLFS